MVTSPPPAPSSTPIQSLSSEPIELLSSRRSTTSSPPRVSLDYTRKVSMSSNEELLKAQLIIDKNTNTKNLNSWDTNHEYLLHMWSEKAAGYRWLHMRSNEYFVRMNNMLSYPIIILSSMLGMGSFIINSAHPNNREIIVGYGIATLNLFVATLSSVQRFNKYAEKAEQHLNNTVLYSKLYRDIHMELSLERKDRKNATMFTNTMKDQYDKIINNNIIIPVHIITKFNHTFTKIAHRPDVANGLFDLNHKQIYDTDNFPDSV
jgi:hypothetical protein